MAALEMDLEIVVADYSCSKHQADITKLLDIYACDPVGGGESLSERTKEKLVSELAKFPDAFSVLAYVGEDAVGLVNCFPSFSTFKCMPIVNIHDVVVLGGYRNRGVCQQMFHVVEDVARARGCCKITLEVLSKNEAAKVAYQNHGFSGYELDPKDGVALFWEKPLQ